MSITMRKGTKNKKPSVWARRKKGQTEMTENKKYGLTDETKEWCAHTLHRIRALKDFGSVKAGELGGWVESEHNLSQEGDCWIYDNAAVCDNATVCDTATVCDYTDYAVVQGFGREQRTTTFYRLKDGEIGVSCGCFHGTIKQFRDKVKETHGDSKYAKEYLMIADLMELHFGEETADEEKS